MSFITGKYVHQIDNWMIGFPLDREETTWARRLDQAGVPSKIHGKIDFCGEYQDVNETDGIFGDPAELEEFICLPCAESMTAREFYEKHLTR